MAKKIVFSALGSYKLTPEDIKELEEGFMRDGNVNPHDHKGNQKRYPQLHKRDKKRSSI